MENDNRKLAFNLLQFLPEVPDLDKQFKICEEIARLTSEKESAEIIIPESKYTTMEVGLIINNMRREGGGFIQALAKLTQEANKGYRDKIIHSFGEEFKSFHRTSVAC
tara:strand:+ start:7406 stop:7729 length:324 start_codon:yes stop_codon:yes gene_type:complete